MNGTKSGLSNVIHETNEEIIPDKKKCITDILSTFKKEKESFNEKLIQLRTKLQTV